MSIFNLLLISIYIICNDNSTTCKFMLFLFSHSRYVKLAKIIIHLFFFADFKPKVDEMKPKAPDTGNIYIKQ